MARPTHATVSAYIASQPPQARRRLSEVRRAIRKAVPGGKEGISYGIPVVKLDGRAVIYFAGFTSHFSIYPANARLIAAFKDQLAPYEYNSKGTIRFPLDEPAPASVIGAIARYRAKEAAEAGAARRR